MKELLTRNECTAMRGIAILAIVLHNYCHFISKIVQENEYQFFVSHNEQLWQVVTNPDALLPVHLHCCPYICYRSSGIMACLSSCF